MDGLHQPSGNNPHNKVENKIISFFDIHELARIELYTRVKMIGSYENNENHWGITPTLKFKIKWYPPLSADLVFVSKLTTTGVLSTLKC